MAKLEDLPPELLLEIGRYIRNRYRNSDLASLSLVSAYMRPIAQERLLEEPWFKLSNIHLFMAELHRQSWVIPKIRALELWSSEKGREITFDDHRGVLANLFNPPFAGRHQPRAHYPAVSCPMDLWIKLDHTGCANTAKRFAQSFADACEWNIALQHDVVPALLGLLLVSLPTLRALRSSATWLMDFPIITSVLSAEVITVTPWEWEHDWLKGVMVTLAAKLEVLEVPTNYSHMGFIGRPSITREDCHACRTLG